MCTKLKWTGIVIALIFIGLQFTTPRHTNLPFDEAQPNKSLNRTRVSSSFIDNLPAPALNARRLIPALCGSLEPPVISS